VNWFDNPQLRVALIWATVGALTTLGAIVPFFVMDGMNGGYALSCGFGFLTLLFVSKYVPETKGKSLEELETILVR